MDGSKSIFLSKTFWGAAIPMLRIILKMVGVEIPIDNPEIIDAIMLACGVLVVVGRAQANTSLKII